MKYSLETPIVAASMSGSLQSGAIDANQLVSMSVQALVTGSGPQGVVKVQGSNDFGQHTPGGITGVIDWSDIPNASAAIANEASFLSYLIPKIDLCYRWVRVVYVRSSGTGSLTVNTMAQSV